MSELAQNVVNLSAGDEASLIQTLQPGLEAALGRRAEIVQINLVPFTGSSSFAAGRVEVKLRSGEAVSVFVKDLAPENQLDEAKLVREATLERSRREVYVYRHILDSLDLGTPLVYGVRWQEAERLFWLLLEDVGPKRLSRLGDFELWVAAAAWLGRFHTRVRLRRDDWAVPEIGRREITERATNVEQALRRMGDDVASAAEVGLARLAGLVERVFDREPGLVHGEYFGKNVVIRPEPSPAPIAVIDWETAAMGPQLLDLACICAGRWTSDQRQRMRRAYFDAAVLEGGDWENWAAFNDSADAAAVVNAFSWLGWWANGDDAHVARWSRELHFAVTEASPTLGLVR